MKDYELLFIVDGGKTEAEAAKVVDEVGAKLLALGGKAVAQNALGRKHLAYPIAKQDHGWYTVLHLQVDGGKVDDLVGQLNRLDGIVRTVLVSADEVPKPGEVVQTPTAVEESKEAAKVTVPEELRKTAEPVAVKTEEPAAEAPEEKKAPETTKEKKVPAKKASAKDLEEALAEQLKD